MHKEIEEKASEILHAVGQEEKRGTALRSREPASPTKIYIRSPAALKAALLTQVATD